MRRVILSAIAVLAAAPIASAATWQPPTVIAPASPAGAGFYFGLQDLGSVQVRQDARGDFAVAWTRADPASQQSQSHVQLSVRLAGASWTPAEEVAPPGTQLEAMAIDGKGDVTVAFVSTSNPGHPTQAVVRTRSASGRWDAPHAVGGSAAAAAGSDVAFIGADDAGDTLVVFGDPAVQGSQSEFRPAGGAWQAPIVLDPQAPVESIGGFAFGMGGNGIATLMEFQNANPPQNVLARRFTVAGGWEAPLPILTSPAESLVLSRQTSLAVSASGDATFAAVLPDGSLVSTSRATHAAGWTPVITVGLAGKQCWPLSVVVDDHGEAIATCSRGNIAGANGEQGSTLSAMRAGNGTWAPLVDVQDQRWGGNGPIPVAMTGDGHALMLTPTDPLDAEHPSGTLLLERQPGGTWHPAAVPAFDATTGPAWFLLTGGAGPGILALHQFTAPPDGRYVTTGLNVALLGEPATSAGHASLQVVGHAACSSARHPCRSGRNTRLSVHDDTGRARVRITIDRRRSGHWSHLRSVFVRLRSGTGSAVVRLPRGHVRVETAALHDAGTHPWVAYLLVR